MPVQYASIVEEHQAVRSRLGLFDVSHMGRLQIYGRDAAPWLDSLLTRRVVDMQPGQIRYSLICQADGGVLDDVLVYRLAGDAAVADDQAAFQLVVNASNRAKIDAHLQARLDGMDVRISDLTEVTAMIAVQGPQALSVCDPLVDFDLGSLRNYHGTYAEVLNFPCYVSRTGYTGEDGVEVIASAEYAQSIWELLCEQEAAACGLGARDTLRLEAAMPLYGHELSEQINPIEAGLGFAVNLKARQFVGRDALAAARANPKQRVRTGLRLDGKRPARQGATILRDGQAIGEVTSGTYSPTLQAPIAMGYVEPQGHEIGVRLAVETRGKQSDATIVPLPFYRRA